MVVIVLGGGDGGGRVCVCVCFIARRDGPWKNGTIGGYDEL